MAGTSPRVYGGVAGHDRQAGRRAQLIEAGLELLGTADGEPGLTVRGVCRQAGLTARYFYENFDGREELAAAVFEHVVSGFADETLRAVESAPPDTRSKLRAGLGTIVRTIADDPRRGRLLFSPALSTVGMAQRRVASTRMFARLLVGQAQRHYGIHDSAGLDLVAEFLVGGLAQTLTSWLDGSLAVDQDGLVDHCVELFLAAGDPRLASDARQETGGQGVPRFAGGT
ncbi:TetR/AcrR family transcriptional regulator [Haloechinothrix sp. LS1_15]|uniref:TetR/AcrR family transcriptional regulator n=1 Tax=Haloechinothrix sp. LS1_15 TaxID=2652248 RepID=UPI00294B2D02|nr:TetR/AcrR family transcriptional regulator [Haloechinothrix sp. LS1_15]